MKDITITVPAEVAAALRLPPADVDKTLKRELAVQLYREGIIGIGPARRLADLDKASFHFLLGERHVERHYSDEEWEQDRAAALDRQER